MHASKYGRDIANLYGNTKRGRTHRHGLEVRLSGTYSAGSYANYARSFREVNAFGMSSVDKAVLTDAAVDPPGYGLPGAVVQDDLARILWLDGFETVERWDSTSGSKLDDINDVDQIFAWWE